MALLYGSYWNGHLLSNTSVSFVSRYAGFDPIISAGHDITGNLRIISGSRIRSIIAKNPKERFSVHIVFQKCREKIAASLNEFSNRWC